MLIYVFLLNQFTYVKYLEFCWAHNEFLISALSWVAKEADNEMEISPPEIY